MTPSEMPSWLVRTAQNTILGPFGRDEVVQMILDRKLTLEDEVGKSEGYWIFLSEREEILQHLGIEVPPQKSEEDTTETAGRLPQRTLEILEQPQTTLPQGGTTVSKKRHEIPKLPTLRPVEGPSLWRGVVLILMGVAIVAVFRVLQLLGSK